jgi:hypothetical protein
MPSGDNLARSRGLYPVRLLDPPERIISKRRP